MEHRGASVLHRLANAIEREAPEQLGSPDAHAEELYVRVIIEEERSREDRKDLERYTETQLCASLLNLASDIERRARLNFTLESDVEKLVGNLSTGTIARTEETVARID